MASYILTFGKYKGLTMEQVWERDADYVRWLSEKSYNVAARSAADRVLSAERTRASKMDLSLQMAVNDILDTMDEDNDLIMDYPFEVHVSGNAIMIAFQHSDVMAKDFDVLEVRNFLHRDDDEHYEAWEDTPRPAELPTPNPETAMWYAFPDNFGMKPLNVQPVMLAEAVKLLENYLRENQ